MGEDPGGNNIIFQLILLLFFTLLNAFFAGAEMAVVSVNRNRIRTLAENGDKKAAVVQSLFEDSTRFLSAIQVAITFAGFYSSASAASGVAPVLAQQLERMNIPYSEAVAHNGVTLILMFFNLVFGELVPKRIALQKAEAFCMMTVMPVHYISILLSPFIKLLSASTKGVLKLLGLKAEEEESPVTEEEILWMLKSGYERGTFDDEERRMIHSVFAFDDRSGTEIMVPRQSVEALDIEKNTKDFIYEVLECDHSRIPVYEGNIDNIIGILSVKDVMMRLIDKKFSDENLTGQIRRDGSFVNFSGLRETALPDKQELRGMLRKPYFVPEKKNADELFRQMRKDRASMAVLIDEYGGFSGILTMKDLVEEIVGEIHEENEAVQPEIQQVDDGEFLLDGGIPISDINERFDLKLFSEDYDTISGYLIEQLGYIPNEHEGGSVKACGWIFAVEKTQGNRICSVRMKKADQAE